jgi:hypothetical protein
MSASAGFNDEFRFHRPTAARIAAVVKLGVGLALSSLFLSVVCIFVWNRFAEQQGRCRDSRFFSRLSADVFQTGDRLELATVSGPRFAVPSESACLMSS